MSYDLYTTWGHDGTRELDEDAVYREFKNAGVSYCGDFSEFIETGYDGYESVNDVAIRHAINREKERRSQEMMMFRELAARQSKYGVLMNQAPIDIYIPEFDKADSVYLMHSESNCAAMRDSAWLGGFSTQDEFVDYVTRKIKSGRHVLECPVCSPDSFRGDPVLLAIGKAIVYSIKNGRPMPRKERRKIAAPGGPSQTRQSAPSQRVGYYVQMNSKRVPLRTPDDELIFVSFFHSSNQDCLGKNEFEQKGPFKNAEDAFNSLNVGVIGERDTFVFPCPRCHNKVEYEKYTMLKGLHKWIDFEYELFLCQNPKMRERVIEDNKKRRKVVDSFAVFANYHTEQTKRITAMARHEIDANTVAEL